MDKELHLFTEQPFSMYGSSHDIYAETAFYRQFAKHAHQHDYYQCMVITKGSCVHRIGERKTLLQVHDAFILPPGLPHLMDNPSSSMEFYQLAIKKSFFLKLIKTPSLLEAHHVRGITEQGIIQNRLSFHVSLPPGEFHSMLSLMDCLILELSNPAHTNIHIVENVAASILLIFNRVLSSMYDLANGDMPHSQKYRIDTIETILRYIDMNYSKPLTADVLAKQISMSRSAFFENFYKVVGQSPHQYIIGKRIAAAKQLLLDTYMSETEIAACVGFRDLSTFHRNFSKSCGCTPGQYRSRTKANASYEL